MKLKNKFKKQKKRAPVHAFISTFLLERDGVFTN